MAYAAWALCLSRISGWDCVGFAVNLSGRTVPRPPALAVIGPVVSRAPFSTAVPWARSSMGEKVSAWLASVHRLTLGIMEFDGVAGSLPDDMRNHPNVTTTSVQYLVDMPEMPPSWTFKATQTHGYLLDWYFYPSRSGNDVLWSELEFNFAKVDEAWAKEAAKIPVLFLEGLIYAASASDAVVGNIVNSTRHSACT
ncbi:hypothetical protein MCOR25_004881 [Pyricularia grisea]|nr:hypothetical protein MCOR25_004881 [Pyricularia grisea]